jgi:hypothetical protein
MDFSHDKLMEYFPASSVNGLRTTKCIKAAHGNTSGPRGLPAQ